MALRTALGTIGIALACLALPSALSPLNARLKEGQATKPMAGLAGHWPVVPRRTPESIAIGGIPRSFILSKDGSAVTGEFRFNGWVYPITNMVARPDGFAFDLEGKPPFTKMRAKLSEDGRYLDVWIGDDVVGVAPFPARRVTARELAAVEHTAPRPDNMTKLALPPLQHVGVKNLAPTPPMGWNSWNVFREAVMTRRCAPWRMRWYPAACATLAIVMSRSMTVGRASVTPEACWSSDGNASISKLMRFVSSQAE